MRSSSWLYQYSSQTKFTYGLCPSGQGRGTVYPSAGPPTNQAQEYVRTYSNDTDAQLSPSLHSDRSETESHGASKIAQSTDYPNRRLHRDDAEPVDMSISGAEQHEGRVVQGAISDHQQHALDDAIRYHHKQYHKSSLHLAGYRAKFAQCHGTQYTSGCADVLSVPGTKYYLTDLDREYCCGAERSGLLLHKRLPTKGLLAPPSIATAAAEPPPPPPPPDATSLENWGTNPAWSDALQRVPDVVHQELSPYITTPTTPVNTPDSDTLGHPEAPIFNFDWAGTEQHVPNLKITFHRSSNAATATSHPASQSRKQHQDAVQITLQLPRRKGQSTENDSKDFPK